MNNLKPINCWLVVYPMGARGDFVAGWLGTLPNFLNARWHIDIITGKSFCDFKWMSELSSNPYQNAERILNNNRLTANKTCNYNIACGFHALPCINQQINDNFNILTIDLKEHNYEKIDYEYIIKTNSIVFRSYDDYMNDVAFLNRTGSDPEWWKDPLRDISEYPKQQSEIYKSIKNKKVLEYDKLFQEGGSRYLCEIAELEASDKHHEYWNTMLKWAESV